MNLDTLSRLRPSLFQLGSMNLDVSRHLHLVSLLPRLASIWFKEPSDPVLFYSTS